jgi:hypothetical protein
MSWSGAFTAGAFAYSSAMNSAYTTIGTGGGQFYTSLSNVNSKYGGSPSIQPIAETPPMYTSKKSTDEYDFKPSPPVWKSDVMQKDFVYNTIQSWRNPQ